MKEMYSFYHTTHFEDVKFSDTYIYIYIHPEGIYRDHPYIFNFNGFMVI